MKKVTSITAIVWMALASTTWAGNSPTSITMVPPQINYQGRLVTVSNTPYVDALHMIDLALYPPFSGTKLWNERYFVQTKDGYFSVNLGTGSSLFATNADLWRVLWKTNSADPDTFFMGLTVWTDPLTARTNANAVEATPRQQFLSAPFAMRSFQSVYASRADGIFQAPQGVSTTNIMSPTTNAIAVNANLQVSSTITANYLFAPPNPNLLMVDAHDGTLCLGVTPTYGGAVAGFSREIFLGAPPSNVSGSDVQVSGKSVDIVTTNLTVNSLSVFVHTTGSGNFSTTVSKVNIDHGIDVANYDVYIVGWYASAYVPGIRWMKVYPGQSYAQVQLTANPSYSSTVTIDFLGIRKGLVK